MKQWWQHRQYPPVQPWRKQFAYIVARGKVDARSTGNVCMVCVSAEAIGSVRGAITRCSTRQSTCRLMTLRHGPGVAIRPTGGSMASKLCYGTYRGFIRWSPRLQTLEHTCVRQQRPQYSPRVCTAWAPSCTTSQSASPRQCICKRYRWTCIATLRAL